MTTLPTTKSIDTQYSPAKGFPLWSFRLGGMLLMFIALTLSLSTSSSAGITMSCVLAVVGLSLSVVGLMKWMKHEQRCFGQLLDQGSSTRSMTAVQPIGDGGLVQASSESDFAWEKATA